MGHTSGRTEVFALADFVRNATFEQIGEQALSQLKIRVLDTLGVAIGALDAVPLVSIRNLLFDLDGDRPLGGTTVSLIGGGSAPLDRAAFYNGALSRYLDFMDSYIGVGETNHPSDNLGAVLAASESVGAGGKEFLVALAVAYQVHVRLSDVAPVRAKGFDHTTQGAYAAAAASAKALRLSAEQIGNAIAISGTANNALRVTRTGNLSNWKGLAYPNTAKEGAFAALLASRGVTGPEQVFEGNKGFKDSIAGPFEIDWGAEGLDAVLKTIVKKHNAEIHSQSALDAALDIRAQDGFNVRAVKSVHLRTFDVAFSIIGGGEEGSKHSIRTKEEADHSLPYMIAAALLDGRVTPDQYLPERIVADDVQDLLAKVSVAPDPELTAAFPAHLPAVLDVELANGVRFSTARDDYEGFFTNPLDWAGAKAKFDFLASPFASASLRDQIAQTVHEFEDHSVADLTALLREVSRVRDGELAHA